MVFLVMVIIFQSEKVHFLERLKANWIWFPLPGKNDKNELLGRCNWNVLYTYKVPGQRLDGRVLISSRWRVFFPPSSSRTARVRTHPAPVLRLQSSRFVPGLRKHGVYLPYFLISWCFVKVDIECFNPWLNMTSHFIVLCSYIYWNPHNY